MAELEKPKQVPAPGELTPIDIPRIYGTAAAIQGTGSDLTIVFYRPRPALNAQGGLSEGTALNEFTGAVTLSMQTAKDLSIILSETIATHEKEYGQIQTPFMRKRQEKK